MSEKSALVAALVKAQAEMGGAKKDSTNPHFKSKYADLESVTAAIKPVAKENGLAYVQKFHERDNGVAVETIILHESGEQLSNGVLRVPASKEDAQGYGSAITYARRYSLSAAFGLCQEDDDGNAASKKDHPPAEDVITESQAADIKAECDELKVDVKKFCAHMKIPSIEAMPKSKWDQACAALTAKRHGTQK